MNKSAFFSISVFLCGIALFTTSILLAEGVLDFTSSPTVSHIDVSETPVDEPVNIESDGELAAASVEELPEIVIIGTPPKVTGGGAARRRKSAVEAKQPEAAESESKSLSLPGETRFSTQAARDYDPFAKRHKTKSVHLHANPDRVGKPTYKVPDHRDEPPMEIIIDMR